MQAAFVAEETLCGLKPIFWALKSCLCLSIENEWLVCGQFYSRVGSPVSAESDVIGWCLRCFGQFGPLSWNSLSGPKNLTRDHLMKIEWLITNVTVVASSIRAECAVFGFFGQIKLILWPESHSLLWKPPLVPYKDYSWSLFNRNRVIGTPSEQEKGLFLAFFTQWRLLLWPRSHFVIWNPPLEP